MKSLLLAAVATIALVGSASAAVIATFAQTSLNNTVVATDNSVTTNIVIDDAQVSVPSFLAGPIASAYFSSNSTSTDAAITVAGAVIQHYDGNFCITSAINCGGTNYLSGVFSDAAFGALGGPGLVVNVNNPPDSLTLTSDVIAASQLIAPSSYSIAFTNLTPSLSIDGSTIDGFTAAFAGVVSASATPVPEPASLALLGLGLIGLGSIRMVRRHG